MLEQKMNIFRMRRDSDLIRKILMTVETEPRCEVFNLSRITSYEDEAVYFHTRLLVEKGFLRTYFPDRGEDQPWLCIRLTWEGYDFLDAVRDPVIWRRVKLAAGKAGLWSVETLAAVARAMLIARVET